MPNQLASNKRRKSLAEHEVVLAALEAIAREQHTSSMELMRKAIREVIRKYSEDSSQLQSLQSVVLPYAPIPPKQFSSAAQLSRFKRLQREFDQILLELNLASPEDIEKRNSIVTPNSRIRIVEFEPYNAKK